VSTFLRQGKPIEAVLEAVGVSEVAVYNKMCFFCLTLMKANKFSLEVFIFYLFSFISTYDISFWYGHFYTLPKASIVELCDIKIYSSVIANDKLLKCTI
jgi:hypothetical protein